MGFFSNLIENKALKVFSRQAAEEFSSLSNDEAAMVLVHAVDIAVKMGDNDDANSLAMARIILDPQSGSSNDCLFIYDAVLSVYMVAEKSGNQTIKRLGNNAHAYRLRITSMLMGYRVIMFLLAERAGKVERDVSRVFYTKTTLCTEDAVLTKALSEFREQLVLESKSGLLGETQPIILNDKDIDFYKTSIELWSLSGRFSHL